MLLTLSMLSRALLLRLGLLVVSLMLLLLAIMKLITDTSIIHLTKLKILEPIVMTIKLDRISNDVLNAVVVPHHFDLVNDSVLV